MTMLARFSTGPRTLTGKRRSRRNALTHGLTARSVVDVFEDDVEFRSFAGQVASAYPAPSPVARELVHRLIGLLWRLRRAHAIETGLLAIQGKLQRDIRISAGTSDASQQNMFALLQLELTAVATASEALAHERARSEAKARAFLRLCNINGDALDRLGRYETALWRQAVQTIFMLEKTNLPQGLLPLGQR